MREGIEKYRAETREMFARLNRASHEYRQAAGAHIDAKSLYERDPVHARVAALGKAFSEASQAASDARQAAEKTLRNRQGEILRMI